MHIGSKAGGVPDLTLCENNQESVEGGSLRGSSSRSYNEVKSQARLRERITVFGLQGSRADEVHGPKGYVMLGPMPSSTLFTGVPIHLASEAYRRLPVIKHLARVG